MYFTRLYTFGLTPPFFWFVLPLSARICRASYIALLPVIFYLFFFMRVWSSLFRICLYFIYFLDLYGLFLFFQKSPKYLSFSFIASRVLVPHPWFFRFSYIVQYNLLSHLIRVYSVFASIYLFVFCRSLFFILSQFSYLLVKSAFIFTRFFPTIPCPFLVRPSLVHIFVYCTLSINNFAQVSLSITLHHCLPRNRRKIIQSFCSIKINKRIKLNSIVLIFHTSIFPPFLYITIV